MYFSLTEMKMRCARFAEFVCCPSLQLGMRSNWQSRPMCIHIIIVCAQLFICIRIILPCDFYFLLSFCLLSCAVLLFSFCFLWNDSIWKWLRKKCCDYTNSRGFYILLLFQRSLCSIVIFQPFISIICYVSIRVHTRGCVGRFVMFIGLLAVWSARARVCATSIIQYHITECIW